jgi:hypothetical protein
MMRRAWLAAPALMVLSGCAALDPAAVYRAAARSLSFRLEAVHPKLDLRFPLDRSALVLGVDLAVENPSKVLLSARTLEGAIHLDSAAGSFPIGQLGFPSGVELQAASRRTLRAELRLPYAEIQRAWKTLESVALHGGAGTWRIEGRVTLDILGIPLVLPLRTSMQSGNPQP